MNLRKANRKRHLSLARKANVVVTLFIYLFIYLFIHNFVGDTGVWVVVKKVVAWCMLGKGGRGVV